MFSDIVLLWFSVDLKASLFFQKKSLKKRALQIKWHKTGIEIVDDKNRLVMEGW